MANAMIDAAVRALSDRIGDGFDGSAKFVIEGEGAVIIDGANVRAAAEDAAAEVTMTADADTFRDILSGDLNPTAAYMSGKLALDGDMAAAMKLGVALG